MAPLHPLLPCERGLGGNSASFKINYKGEALDESAQFEVYSINEPDYWKGRVRDDYESVVKVSVYRVNEDDYASDRCSLKLLIEALRFQHC